MGFGTLVSVLGPSAWDTCRGHSLPSSVGQGSLPRCSANTPDPTDALPLLRMAYPNGTRGDPATDNTGEQAAVASLRYSQPMMASPVAYKDPCIWVRARSCLAVCSY